MSTETYTWLDQNCPICEVKPTKFLGRRGGTAHSGGSGVECKVWCCERCGLIFPNPMPIPAGGVEQHYGVDPGEYFEHHEVEEKDAGADHLLTEAEALLGTKGRLVDVGAGRGEILRAAKEAGWEAIGIEPSSMFADYAANHSGAEVLCKSLEDCGLPDKSIDTVILSAVLEHLYQPNEVVQEIARILRPGGALFIDVPNEVGLYFRIGNLYQHLRGRDWVVNLAPTFSPFHVFGFTPKSLTALLSKHGFKVKKWRVYPGTSLVPARGGLAGSLEQYASKAVTALSSFGNLGTYIETWAVKT